MQLVFRCVGNLASDDALQNPSLFCIMHICCGCFLCCFADVRFTFALWLDGFVLLMHFLNLFICVLHG